MSGEWSEENDDEDEMPGLPRKEIVPADRELLVLAARALGAQFVEVDGEGYGNLHFEDGSVTYAWNPLVHRDDALDLMAALQMQVDYQARGHRITGDVTVACGPNIYVSEPKGGDVSIATCRAIVRAASLCRNTTFPTEIY